MNSWTKVQLLATGSAMMLAVTTAHAEDAAATVPASAQVSGGDQTSAEIVVTGTSGKQRKFDAPYSISTIDQQQIKDKAPHSVADLLKSTPGLTVEASGGEAGSENVVIRGLPWSGWRLIDLNQDGMPIFESNTEKYMNIDELYRVDLDTKRAEVVRGGTAPLYSNNASGGVVNFITGHGTRNFEGETSLETGTGNRIRGDAYVSGPITDRLSGTVSGFYRQDDGLRYSGIKNVDLGGQIKAGATYELDHGKIWADVKYLNDRGAFYTSVPLTNPSTGESLESLIDPRSGTLTSSAFRKVTIRTVDANGKATTMNQDLQDGIHTKTLTATLGGDYDLGSGFHLFNTYRHTSSSNNYSALVNGSTSDAATYLAGRLSAARSALGSGVTSLRYTIAGSNTVYDPAATDNLVMANTWASVQTKLRYDADDIHFTKDLETPIGVHHLTAGFYYSNYYYKQTEELNAILTNVKNRPDALDIQALNAAGQVVGSVTENGFISYGSGGQSGALHGHSTAFYGADTWNITPKWSVDAGVRHVNREQDGYQGVLGSVTGDATGAVAARSIMGVVSRTYRDEHQHGTSWTIGTGYIFTPRFNVFARYTNTFSFPRFDTLLGNATLPGSTQPLPVAKVKQGEAGVKYALPGFQITATGFWSKFNRLNGSTQVADANGTLTTSNIVFNSRTYGIELETIVSPFKGFDITATGMLQKPKIISIQTLTGTDAQSSSGGEIPRVPKYQLSVEPSYSFRVSNLAVRLYGDVFTIGRRFQDDSNFSRLPAYTSIDLGASITTKSGFQVRAAVNNVANVVGLTEGNSRSAAITSASSVADSTIGRSIFGRNFTLSISKRW